MARYYYERGAYVAAISPRRWRWPTRMLPALEEALFIPIRSYDALGARKPGATTLAPRDERLLSSAPTCATASSEEKSGDPWWKFW